MSKQSGRQEIRCRCGKRLLDITKLSGEIKLEIKCRDSRCNRVIEVEVTADETRLKEVRSPALVS